VISGLLLFFGIFFAIDFITHYPQRYQHGPDIPIKGRHGWTVPRRVSWEKSDIVLGPRSLMDYVRVVSVRDTGNYLFMRVELANDFEVGEGEGKDLLFVFSWGGSKKIESLPGIGAKITPSEPWDAVLYIRDNGGSSLYSKTNGWVEPTYVDRTFFDSHGGTVAICFSKILLVASGWDGVAPVMGSVLVCRDGAKTKSDIRGTPEIQVGRWGTGELFCEGGWFSVYIPTEE